MDTNLKSCIAISILLHIFIAAPFISMSKLTNWPKEKKESILVDYVVMKEVQKILEVKQDLEFKIPDKPMIKIKETVDVKPPEPKQEETKTKEDTIRRASQEMQKRQEELKAAQEIARKQTQIKSTKDYANYYRAIREKIRQRLKENYKSFSREAEVHCVFTLNANGALSDVGIEESSSTSDKSLIEISARSVKEAAPFPPFPKALTLPQMSFNLVISFKKQ